MTDFQHSDACETQGIRLREAHAIGDRQGQRLHRFRVDRRRLREENDEARRLNLLIQYELERSGGEAIEIVMKYIEALDRLFAPVPLDNASPEALERRRARLAAHKEAVLAG